MSFIYLKLWDKKCGNIFPAAGGWGRGGGSSTNETLIVGNWYSLKP